MKAKWVTLATIVIISNLVFIRPNPHYFRRVRSTELKKSITIKVNCHSCSLFRGFILLETPGCRTTPSRFSSSNISSLIATKRKRSNSGDIFVFRENLLPHANYVFFSLPGKKKRKKKKPFSVLWFDRRHSDSHCLYFELRRDGDIFISFYLNAISLSPASGNKNKHSRRFFFWVSLSLTT